MVEKLMHANKKFQFISNDTTDKVNKLDVIIPEIVDPQYGLFTWPSAPVLAQYVFHNQKSVVMKNILEIGCGTALAGVVAGLVGANVTLSDGEMYENCLLNCVKGCKANKLSNVNVIPITWGKVTDELVMLEQIDIILASDCFYDKNDFEDIIFTVSFLLERNPGAVFWTTYQLRSCDYSIEHLLLKWQLKCRMIPPEEFNADFEYIGNSDMSSKHIIQMMEITRQ